MRNRRAASLVTFNAPCAARPGNRRLEESAFLPPPRRDAPDLQHGPEVRDHDHQGKQASRKPDDGTDDPVDVQSAPPSASAPTLSASGREQKLDDHRDT